MYYSLPNIPQKQCLHISKILRESVKSIYSYVLPVLFQVGNVLNSLAPPYKSNYSVPVVRIRVIKSVIYIFLFSLNILTLTRLTFFILSQVIYYGPCNHCNLSNLRQSQVQSALARNDVQSL
jgi:hypothetical protein